MDSLSKYKPLLLALTGLFLLWRLFQAFIWRKFTAQEDIKNLGKPRVGPKINGTAVICGGSLGGLMAARVCSFHFEKVVLIESEKIVKGEVRKNIMQWSHLHLFWAVVLKTCEGLFPGFGARVRQMGGRTAPFLFPYFLGNRVKKDPKTLKFDTLFLSRPYTEELIREMLVETSSNVQILYGHTVAGFLGGGGKLTGVKVRAPDGTESNLDASFVVDSTGPAVHSRRWLPKIGFVAPERLVFHPHVTYVSAEFDLAGLPGRDEWDPIETRTVGAIIGSRPVPQPGQSQISGWIIRLIGDTILITTATWGDDSALPRSLTDMPEFFDSLPTLPHNKKLVRAVCEAHPETKLIIAKPGPCHQVRWVDVETPNNFVALGDTVQRLNAQYGQGVSQISISAATLDACLRKVKDTSLTPEFSRNYFVKLMPRIEYLWEANRISDYGYQSTETVPGETLAYGAKKRTMARKVSAAMTVDPKVTKIMFEGASQVMSHAWTSLNPRVLAWVTYFSLFGMPRSELKQE